MDGPTFEPDPALDLHRGPQPQRDAPRRRMFKRTQSSFLASVERGVEGLLPPDRGLGGCLYKSSDDVVDVVMVVVVAVVHVGRYGGIPYSVAAAAAAYFVFREGWVVSLMPDMPWGGWLVD